MFIGNRCSYAPIKGGWPGQMRFKMAGKFKTKQASSLRGACITGVTHLQSTYILSVADEHNPPSCANAAECY